MLANIKLKETLVPLLLLITNMVIAADFFVVPVGYDLSGLDDSNPWKTAVVWNGSSQYNTLLGTPANGDSIYFAAGVYTVGINNWYNGSGGTWNGGYDPTTNSLSSNKTIFDGNNGSYQFLNNNKDQPYNFNNCDFINFGGNSSGGHGGVFKKTSGLMAFTNCSFKNNKTGNTTHDGGAIRTFQCTLNLHNCQLVGNRADRGTAISVSTPGSLTITNSVFAFNGNTIPTSKDSKIGAVIFTDGIVETKITNSIFVNNDCTDTDGTPDPVIHRDGTSGFQNLKNCIFWNNDSSQAVTDLATSRLNNCAGHYESSYSNATPIGHIAINQQEGKGSAEGILYAGFESAPTTTGYSNRTDYNIDNYKLISNSDLIDAGGIDLTEANYADVPTTDFFGVTRQLDHPQINTNGTIDLGISEFEPNLTPVLGLTINQTETELTWEISDEVNVKEYQVINSVTGEVLTTVVANDSASYVVTIDENTPIKLVVVDESGYKQTFHPYNNSLKTVSYELKAGWNLITIPLENANLTNLNKVTTGDFWLWTGIAYELTVAPKPTEGVWVYAQRATKVTITGAPVKVKLKLVTGWNLVGPTENCDTPADALLIYTWNDVYSRVLKQNILIEGVGYWIFSF